MSINASLFNPGQTGQSYESQGVGDTNSMLSLLEGRVSQTLAQKDNSLVGGGAEMGFVGDPKAVVALMAELSVQHEQGTIAGMSHNTIV
ncbi:MAG: hypothetical protein ABIA67_01025 [Candidatus Margulisiibacteriota bacterium]